MGQARKRGTFEQRVEQARERQRIERERLLQIRREAEANMTAEQKAARSEASKTLAVTLATAAAFEYENNM